jgi:glycerol-3-phosphate dehydrogenase (NAD(P)+)
MAVSLAPRTSTVLWARDAEFATKLRNNRCNDRYLPGIRFPDSLQIDESLAAAVAGADLALAAVPVAGLRALVRTVVGIHADIPVFALCKGIELGTAALPHLVARSEELPASRYGVLSGPSFAEEVARGLPCALALASSDEALTREGTAVLHGPLMRIYRTSDVVGVELAGALKNVLAIAVGICDGLTLGQNARAALITRGLAEMARLGVALGGQQQTFLGLAGVGDLVLTATGDLSRNRRVGLGLARGGRLDDILPALGHVAEGVHTARAVRKLALDCQVETPICDAVLALLDGKRSAADAVRQLLIRDSRAES